MKLSFPVAAAGVVAATLSAGWWFGTQLRKPPEPTPAPAPAADRGPLVYQAYCASCHGPDGHGDGASAAELRPPPRDFAARPWRTEPTPEAIRRATLDGIPGTGMASFRTLPPADLDAVVAHVHRLATAGPVAVQTPSADEKALAAAGFVSLLGTAPPPLALTDAAGRSVRLKDHAGKLVLLHFWGTGCAHCIKEVPALTALERRHPGRLAVLHVCTDEDDAAAAQAVLDRVAPGAAAFTEETGLGVARYGVQSLPTVWLVGPDGTAVGRAAGARDWAADPQAKLIEHFLPPK
jgi:mono/diheme cytochrome c family protein